MPEIVYARNNNTGRIHKRILEDGHLYSQETDNLDEAEDLETITPEELANADRGALCQHCFAAEIAAAETL